MTVLKAMCLNNIIVHCSVTTCALLCVCALGLWGAGDGDKAFWGPGVPAAGAWEQAGWGEGDPHATATPGDRRLPAEHRHSQGNGYLLCWVCTAQTKNTRTVNSSVCMALKLQAQPETNPTWNFDCMQLLVLYKWTRKRAQDFKKR